MGFEYLHAQENRLASLQSNLASYKDQLTKQNKRKGDIESILKDMKSIVSNRIDDVNGHFNKMINIYDDATKGITSATTLVTTTSSDKEKDISSDDNMSNSLSYLQSELNDVNRKIGELESSISNTNSQISSCQSAIRAEKRSIAVEFSNKYNNAQSRVNAVERAYKADPSSAQLKREYDKACRERDAARRDYNNYKGWL